jgi:hypothetical protein
VVTFSASPVNPDPVTDVVVPQNVAGVSGNPNRLTELEGENDRHQVRFAEAIQTVVGSDPDISFAILKNGGDNIVAQPIPVGERLDLGAEFLDLAPQQLGSWRTAKPVAHAGDPQSSIVIKKNSLGTDPDFGFVRRLILIG